MDSHRVRLSERLVVIRMRSWGANEEMKMGRNIYIGDNGQCLCEAHVGNSIRKTGRDISGQEAIKLDGKEAAEHGLRCEVCAAA
jgi:uncharacterized Zn-binding protein involved in type VI secretion